MANNMAFTIRTAKEATGASVIGVPSTPETDAKPPIIGGANIFPSTPVTLETGDPLLRAPREVIETSKAQRPLGDIIQAAAEALGIT